MTENDDSLKLRMTLSNLGDINEQIHVLWQQVNFSVTGILFAVW